jgi:hypothetical protein
MSVAAANVPEPTGAGIASSVQAGLRPSDRAWVLVVTATDSLLRRYYGIQPFLDDPHCLLRVSHAAAARQVALRDGTLIRPGDPIAVLHLWNEHIPRFAPSGPDMAWAITFRDDMVFSLHALAECLAEDRAWRDVQAVHGCVTFGNCWQRGQMNPAAARFGFELVPTEIPSGLHRMGEDILIWCLTRAFNPAALRRHRFRRDRTELWTSRASLVRGYA